MGTFFEAESYQCAKNRKYDDMNFICTKKTSYEQSIILNSLLGGWQLRNTLTSLKKSQKMNNLLLPQ